MNNRDIQIGNIVKTYNLCTGEITIDVINHIYRADKVINCWRGDDEFSYRGERTFRKIKPRTAIWDKSNGRWVFKHINMNGRACFSTVILDASEPEMQVFRLHIPNERVKDMVYIG